MSPFHCPYCGEEDLRPHQPTDGPGHGAWECRGCMRAFQLKFLGLLRPGGFEARSAHTSTTNDARTATTGEVTA